MKQLIEGLPVVFLTKKELEQRTRNSKLMGTLK